MPYAPESITEMQAKRVEWGQRADAFSTTLLTFPFAVERAREMAQHGFHRRLSDLGHAQARLFEILPPDATAPSRRDLHDATAFLQAFVINVFGAIDNLAWVWACEADVRDDRGRPLRRSQIGLMPGGMQAQLRNPISYDPGLS